MNYHTMYRKVSSKKIIRTVNVKGESIVKGGKCTTEKMSPRPCTVTVPPSKTCTTRTTSRSLRVSLIEDDTRARVFCKRTVDEKMIGGVTEGATSIGTIAGQVGETLTIGAIVPDTAVLWMTRSSLTATGAFILGTVDMEMTCGVALKTTSRRSCNGFWAQAGIVRCNACWIGGCAALVKGRLSVSRDVRRDVKQRSGSGLWRRNGIIEAWGWGGGMWRRNRQYKGWKL